MNAVRAVEASIAALQQRAHAATDRLVAGTADVLGALADVRTAWLQQATHVTRIKLAECTDIADELDVSSALLRVCVLTAEFDALQTVLDAFEGRLATLQFGPQLPIRLCDGVDTVRINALSSVGVSNVSTDSTEVIGMGMAAYVCGHDPLPHLPSLVKVSAASQPNTLVVRVYDTLEQLAEWVQAADVRVRFTHPESGEPIPPVRAAITGENGVFHIVYSGVPLETARLRGELYVNDVLVRAWTCTSLWSYFSSMTQN